MTPRPGPQIIGKARMKSPWFSPTWTLHGADGSLLATATRMGLRKPAHIRLADDRVWELHPGRWGIMRLQEGNEELAFAEREDTMGRHWRMAGQSFALELWAKSMVRRHWVVGQGGAEMAKFYGGILSFNTIKIDAEIALPMEAVWLAWSTIVKAWQATGVGTDGE